MAETKVTPKPKTKPKVKKPVPKVMKKFIGAEGGFLKAMGHKVLVQRQSLHQAHEMKMEVLNKTTIQLTPEDVVFSKPVTIQLAYTGKPDGLRITNPDSNVGVDSSVDTDGMVVYGFIRTFGKYSIVKN